MGKTLFVVIILFFTLADFFVAINVTNEFADKCITSTSDFWTIYKKHFALVSRLTIHVLQTKKHEINQFVDSFFKLMNRHEFLITLETHVRFFSDTSNNQRLPLDDFNTHENTCQNLQPITHEEFLQIKMLTSDSVNGYFIIASNTGTLHHFLDDNFNSVIPETRSSFALLFVDFDCTTIANEIGDVLKRLWIEYNVNNALAQSPCSCEQDQIYIYRPFSKTDETWGLTQRYTFKQITTNFRTITNPLFNLNRFALNIGIFSRPPHAIVDLPKLLQESPIYKNLSFSKNVAGVDGLILGILAEYLNFEVVLVQSPTSPVGGYFGRQLPNGTVSKSAMTDVMEGKTVYSANSRFVMTFRDVDVEWTVTHIADALCMLAPGALKVPNWMSLFNCFNTLSWILISVTFVVCMVVWYFIGPTRSLKDVWWTILSYLLGISESVTPELDQLFFLTSCLLFNVVVIGIVQGSLFSSFTTTTYYPDIHTLEQLDQIQLPVASTVWFYIRDDSPTIKNLKKKTIPKPPNANDMAAFYRNIVTTDNQANLEYLIKSQYVDEEGAPLLHVVDECLAHFLMAHIVQKGSPFLPVFNNLIKRVVEAGLTLKWHQDVLDSMEIEKMISLNKQGENVQGFTLYDLQIAFYLLVLGIVAAFLVFFVELLTRRK